MIHQARYCHLETLPLHEKGEAILPGDKVGTMGNTGQSSAPHLHFDLIQTIETHVYRLSEIQNMITDWDRLAKQYFYFLDREMFKHGMQITTFFADPYYIIGGEYKYHPAYDVVPIDRHETAKHFDIYWNRSKTGQVTSIGFDTAYGNYITIAYEA